MPRDAFVLKIERELCQPRCTRKVSGLSRNRPLTTTPATPRPTFFNKCMGSFTSPANHITMKKQETGPSVYSPYLRRLERLTIYRCHYKAAHSPLLFKDPECWSGRGLEPATSRTAVRSLLDLSIIVSED